MNEQTVCIPSSQQSGLPRTSWRELGIHTYVKIFIIAGIVGTVSTIESQNNGRASHPKPDK